MKNEIMQRIVSVINALNNVSVKGEENLANLSGSITILKEVAAMISQAQFAATTPDEEIKSEEVK